MPTENIEQQLTNALDNSNNKQVENIIEQNPVETSKILPENSPLQNEAEEVVDGDKRTDRVDDEVVKESIDDYHTPGGFLNRNQDGMLKDEVIDNDFFANYANTMLGGNGVTEDTLKPTSSIYSTPKIDRASHSDYINGKIDRNEYMNQLRNQSSQAGEALKRASKMMDDERERYANEGGQFNRGHVGAYALPAGNAKNFADSRLNEMNEGFADIDAKAYSKNYKPEFYEGENDLTISDMPKVEEIIEKEPEIIKEEVPEDNPIYKEAEQVTDGDERTSEANNEKVEEGIKNDNDIDWDAIEAKWYAEHEAIANPPSEYKDEFGREVPDFVSNDEALSEDFDNADELYDYLMNNGYGDDVFDPGLEDLNQYVDDINDKTVIDTKAPEVNENDFVKSDVLPSADNVLELKPDEQKEAIEENAPEEEKEETKKLIKLLSGNSKSITGGSNVPSEKTDISTKQQSSNIQSAGKNILGNVGASSGITSSKIPSVKEEKKPAAPGSTASKAGGGSMPVANEGKYAAVSHSNGGSMSSGSAGSGMFGKVGTLGRGGAITSKKANLPGGESKGGSSVLRSPQGAKNSSTDMNVLSLRDKIIAKSKAWPGQRLDKDGLLIVVRDDNRVFINRQLFENFIKDNPNSVQQLRQIVDKY